jgi:hypothetical protein
VFIVVIVVVDRDGDAPEGELVCNNIVKVRTLLGLDALLEVVNVIRRWDVLELEGMRHRFALNNTASFRSWHCEGRKGR